MNGLKLECSKFFYFKVILKTHLKIYRYSFIIEERESHRKTYREKMGIVTYLYFRTANRMVRYQNRSGTVRGPQI